MRLPCGIPVSYTHLDVYKRQARAFEGMRGIPIQYYPQRGLVTALDFALTDVVAVFAMLLLATVLVRFAVSYTHLDVYKRQGL